MSPTKYYMDRSKAEIHILFMGDRQVCKLPFGLKCHELFVTLYSIHTNLSDLFLLLYIKEKKQVWTKSGENIILIGRGQYTKILTGCTNKDK